MKLLKNITTIIALLLLSIKGFNQDVLTMYNMKLLPQNMFQNPAKIPQNKLNISLLPVVSSVSVAFNNTGFAYSDFIAKRADDSLVLTTDNMLSKLKDQNVLSTSISTDIFGFGFRVKQNYFSFNATAKSDAAFTYTKDAMTFLLKGNSAFLGKEASFNLKLNTTSYMEYGVSFSHITKNEKLSYGARFKLLSGIANSQTERTNISMITNADDYSIKATADILINASAIDTGSNNFKLEDNIFGNNKGTAFDFGIQYQVTKKLSISASVIDLGAITWKNNVTNYRSKNPGAVFNFTGFNVQNFFKNNTSNQAALDSLGDSLRHTFDLVKSINSYKTKLATKIFVGANYQLNKTLSVGVLYFGKLINEELKSSYSISLNQTVGKWFNVSASYSSINTISNLGLGLSIAAGPFQLYAVTDNILAFSKPEDARSTNLQAGLNFSFGRNKRVHKAKVAAPKPAVTKA